MENQRELWVTPFSALLRGPFWPESVMHLLKMIAGDGVYNVRIEEKTGSLYLIWQDPLRNE